MMKKMVMMIAVLVAGVSLGQVQGTIVTPEGQKIEGSIKWKASARAYAVVKRGGNVELEMEPDKVADLIIPEPAALKGAIANVQGGNPTVAIPVLEKINQDYLRLKWDEVATRYLAEAQLKSGKPAEARKVCEKVISSNADAAYLGEMAPVYWESLIKCDRSAKAEELMAKAIKAGDRRASAFALIRRGDMILAGGETQEIAKKSLRDGFLRVVTLYRDVKDAQPEALYKAAKCFDKLGQSSRSDAFRTQLKNDFASSEWAKK